MPPFPASALRGQSRSVGLPEAEGICAKSAIISRQHCRGKVERESWRDARCRVYFRPFVAFLSDFDTGGESLFDWKRDLAMM